MLNGFYKKVHQQIYVSRCFYSLPTSGMMVAAAIIPPGQGMMAAAAGYNWVTVLCFARFKVLGAMNVPLSDTTYSSHVLLSTRCK